MRKNEVSIKKTVTHIFFSLLILLTALIYWSNNAWTMEALDTLLKENTELFQRIYRLERIAEPPGISYPPYDEWENKERGA